jgi:hypothetical protein
MLPAKKHAYRARFAGWHTLCSITVRMSPRSRLSMALAVSAPLLFAGAAGGQTTPSGTNSLYLKNNNEGVVRGPSYNADFFRLNQFNQAHCIDNELVTFNIDILGPSVSGYHLEAWIGSACDLRASRVGSTKSCRMIGAVGNSVERMEIWVRDMVGPLDSAGSGEETGGTGGTGGTSGTGGSAATDTGGTGGTDTGLGGTVGSSGTFGTAGTDVSSAGSGGTAGLPSLPFVIPGGTGGDPGTGGTGIFPFADTAGAGSEVDENGLDGPPSVENEQPISVCQSDINTTPFDRTIYFVLVNNDGLYPGNAMTGPTAKWAYNYDMGGPSAPVGVNAGIGESALIMKWTQASDAPIDLKQYVFLCDPPPGSGSSTGAAGAGGEGSDQDGSGVSDICTTAAFHEGQVPSYDLVAQHMCGNVQSTTTEGEAGPLVNNVRYAIGIASRDGYYNVGPISNIVCGTPELVTDFFEAYRKAGGRGGGGFCSIGKVRTHALTTLFLLGALGLIARRRTRARGDRRSAS